MITIFSLIFLSILSAIAILYMIKSNKKISMLKEEIDDELKIIK